MADHRESGPLLDVQGVSKSFGGVKAVVDVQFSLNSGELLGIIGPNGSGKTTLVNLITGFIRPDTGKVIYRGTDVTGWMPYRIARLGIARTFQMAKPFAELAAFKNLIVPLSLGLLLVIGFLYKVRKDRLAAARKASTQKES